MVKVRSCSGWKAIGIKVFRDKVTLPEERGKNEQPNRAGEQVNVHSPSSTGNTIQHFIQ